MPKIRSKDSRSATQPRDAIRSSSAPIVRYRAADPPPILATDADAPRFCGIPYQDVHRYFDTLKYLTKTEISATDQAWLRTCCKFVDIRVHGDWIVPKRGAPYQLNIWPWRFRVEVHVPYPEQVLRNLDVLKFFANLPNTKVTAAHIARDFTFADEFAKTAMLEVFYTHYFQPWQHDHEWKTFFQRVNPLCGELTGFSTGRRGRGNYFTCYVSQHCRIDGSADCLHGEGRHHGAKALKQIRICSPQDLIEFDHLVYWREKDLQTLRRLDKQRLGQFLRNRSDRTRDQSFMSCDLRFGGFMWRFHAVDSWDCFSVQQFIRSYPAARSAKNIICTVDTEGRKP
ncbi:MULTISPECIES: hypothetical protein [unclassified Bradyrhizobium]|uniref:hypothetical protein n=1 Tax=unclassified Bradyrhizobium TaxID=2631580 RepID=UPI0033951B06